MSRLFGTDGVRGVANKELTPSLAFKLGYAGAKVLTGEMNYKPTILIGTDTRISCAMLECALVAGITSAGADCYIAGVLPTPGIAYLTRKYNCDAGVMISASHNSYEYNGIKFFSAKGYKLPDEVEDRIQAEIEKFDPSAASDLIGDRIGHRIERKNASRDYSEHLKRRMSVDLSGLKIAVDCANGASYHIAPDLLRDLGAEVVAIGIEPDGVNINDKVGSTHMERLEHTVRREGCDIGIAFDGDADRMLAIDENGNHIDGDQIMAIIAVALQKKDKLKDNCVVVTVMSNIGMDIMAKERGLKLHKTKVGDRYVLEEMLRHGLSLGGEQSGHIILAEHGTTGDGMLSALALLKSLSELGLRLSQASKIMQPLPQVLVNARVTNEGKNAIMQDKDILAAIEEEEKRLGDEGRVLVRASGTEPLIRVMVEGKDQAMIEKMGKRLSELITIKYGV